jgi:uncharacterized PurR-regulated membrane protein YhhQ (DUF165 family)
MSQAKKKYMCVYIVASVFMFLLALQLLLARPASVKWILLATQNFHSPLASWRAVISLTVYAFPQCLDVDYINMNVFE